MSHHAEFRLSMTRALRHQLTELLESLDWASLDEERITELEARGGVYQLALDGHPVYVGKSRDNLPGRLGQHRRKLSGRQGDLSARMTFRCAYVDEDLDSVAPEKMLMAEFGERDESEWNYNGFGNKDPGKYRDTSLVKEGHFDRDHQINLDLVVTLGGGLARSGKPVTLRQVMTDLKKQLPYTFRFGAPPVINLSEEDKAELASPKTAREWFGFIAARLPAHWATISLPGYAISYSGLDVTNYASRTGAWSSNGPGATYQAHDPAFEPGAVEAEEVDIDSDEADELVEESA